MTAETATITRPALRRGMAPGPRVSHTTHLREFTMPDQRKLLVDRRCVAFILQRKEAPDTQTIIAFKTQAQGCPVVASYTDVKAWWFGDGTNGKAE